jgi:hypothetical protein
VNISLFADSKQRRQLTNRLLRIIRAEHRIDDGKNVGARIEQD